MTELKARLETDLRDAMKSRDELTTSTLRMAIAAVRTEEVSGKAARTLSDQEVLSVLTREAKKRREAATAFADAGRAEQAERERAEEGVISAYLPKQLTDGELSDIVATAVSGVDATGKGAMGQAIKAAQTAVAGRAEGARVAAEVRKHLGL